MVKTYRTKEQIIHQILSTIQKEKVARTKIMYEAYLSYEQLRSYLDMLIEKELIKLDEKNDNYVITAKGNKFLEVSTELKRLY